MIPKDLRPFFWEINLETFEPREYPQYTIGRILEFGTDEAVAWMKSVFTEEEIKKVIREEHRLSRKSANFWALIYGISPEEVAAFTNPAPPFPPMPKPHHATDRDLATEAKAIVVLAFRNGPIEDVHAGQHCPTCAGKSEYSHITDGEMKRIMKRAVNMVYTLLSLKVHESERYERLIHFGNLHAHSWDDPVLEDL